MKGLYNQLYDKRQKSGRMAAKRKIRLNKLLGLQRLSTIGAAEAYRKTSTETKLIPANIPPVDLVIKQKARMRRIVKKKDQRELEEITGTTGTTLEKCRAPKRKQRGTPRTRESANITWKEATLLPGTESIRTGRDQEGEREPRLSCI